MLQAKVSQLPQTHNNLKMHDFLNVQLWDSTLIISNFVRLRANTFCKDWIQPLNNVDVSLCASIFNMNLPKQERWTCERATTKREHANIPEFWKNRTPGFRGLSEHVLSEKKHKNIIHKSIIISHDGLHAYNHPAKKLQCWIFNYVKHKKIQFIKLEWFPCKTHKCSFFWHI